MSDLKIGVVGYSNLLFDMQEAEEIIRDAYDKISAGNPGFQVIIVSGLTNLGIPAVAYKEAVTRGWKTIGIACSKAYEYELFPVNETIIVGNEWGEESPTFLDSIDVLVRVGGGKQSQQETQIFKGTGKLTLEYELATKAVP